MNRSGTALVVAAMVLFTGCSWNRPDRSEITPPCGKEGSARIELGRPWAEGTQFNAAGGELYVTVDQFGHGGLGQPEVGRTILYIGEGVLEDFELGQKPQNTSVTVNIVEDDFERLELQPGLHWLVTTNDANVAILSCEENGVSAVTQ